MKSTSASLGKKHNFLGFTLKRKFRFETKVENFALCYDANNNQYSIAPKSVPPNLFYSMELGARSLIDVWPFLNNRLLDIGCGKKPYSLLINSLVRQYIGIDLSDSSEENRSDIHGDGLQLPFKDESFECILSTDMLDEVYSPLDLFREANRVLLTDSYIVVLVSNHYNIFNNCTSYAYYTADGLKYLAEKSGFNVVVMRTKGSFIPFLFNFTIQCLYKIHEKVLRLKNPNLIDNDKNFKHFNKYMVLLQKFYLKITPLRSLKTDIDWEEPQKRNFILKSFHIGYLMVAKKVFSSDRTDLHSPY